MQQITKSKEEARNVKDVEFIFENTESFSIPFSYFEYFAMFNVKNNYLKNSLFENSNRLENHPTIELLDIILKSEADTSYEVCGEIKPSKFERLCVKQDNLKLKIIVLNFEDNQSEKYSVEKLNASLKFKVGAYLYTTKKQKFKNK
jgi:hypothetical protein